MAEEASQAPKSELAARHGRSISQMHSTAKWVLSTASGLGALLIAGLRLADVRDILRPPVGLDDWPAALAVVAVVGAVAAIGFVIHRASRLFTVTFAGFDALIDELVAADIRAAEARRDASPPANAAPAWKSDRRLKKVVGATRAHLLPAAKDPDDAYLYRDELAAALREGQVPVTVRRYVFRSAKELREEMDRLDASMAAALMAADEVRVKEAFDELARTIYAAGVIVTMAVVGFVALTALASRRPPAVSQPTPVLVYQRPQPGQPCTNLTLSGVAIDGTFDEPVVVVGRQGGCPARQFTVTNKVGEAVPVSTTRAP